MPWLIRREALQLGVSSVRILHGTGTGALRESIRTYLSGVRGVQHFRDEDVRFGGAGITVVENGIVQPLPSPFCGKTECWLKWRVFDLATIRICFLPETYTF